MLHLYRVYFDSRDTAIEVVAEGFDEAAEIACLAGMPFHRCDPQDAIVRYLVSYPGIVKDERINNGRAVA